MNTDRTERSGTPRKLVICNSREQYTGFWDFNLILPLHIAGDDEFNDIIDRFSMHTNSTSRMLSTSQTYDLMYKASKNSLKEFAENRRNLLSMYLNKHLKRDSDLSHRQRSLVMKKLGVVFDIARENLLADSEDNVSSVVWEGFIFHDLSFRLYLWHLMQMCVSHLVFGWEHLESALKHLGKRKWGNTFKGNSFLQEVRVMKDVRNAIAHGLLPKESSVISLDGLTDDEIRETTSSEVPIDLRSRFFYLDGHIFPFPQNVVWMYRFLIITAATELRTRYLVGPDNTTIVGDNT